MLPSAPFVVLIAEDDPVFRRLLQFTIERAGYTVVVTANGNEAWERLQQGGIDLLVTDQQMPHCTGIELLHRIANAPSSVDDEAGNSTNHLLDATILCTAKGLEIDRQLLKEQFGLLEVIGKPFSPKQLAHILDQFFQSRKPNSAVAAVGAAIPTPKPTRTVWNVCQNG